MGNLLEQVGIERDRLHFSWISSAEATKFVDVVKEISEKVRALGSNKKLVKEYT
jgi:F420-non-reducing hydrogenase iron-sulfur subunit